MLDSILARFHDNPSAVSESQQATFNACLTDMAAHEDFPKLMAAAAQDDFWFSSDDWRAKYRPYNVQGGILSIPVRGTLLHDFPWALGNYATGYDYILKAYQRGMADMNVRGIALLIHSPGGEVAGCFEAVDKMFAGKTKPVRAFAHEYAYSAAYAVASIADKIIVSRTGGVGSIGVVTSHVDYSKAMDQAGVKITFIKFGAHKTDGNPYEPLSKDAQARIQARIDALGEVFVSTVARNRKLDAKKVRATEALTFTASEGIENGLADAVGPLDDAVAAFAADLSQPAQQEEEQMTEKTSAVDQAALETAVAAARAEGHAEGMKVGAEGERNRISAIVDSPEGKSRPATARMLVKLGVAADAAIEQMKGVPEEVKADAAPQGNTQAQTFAKHVESGAPGISGASGDGEAPSRVQALKASVPGLFKAPK